MGEFRGKFVALAMGDRWAPPEHPALQCTRYRHR